ncbi:MAG: hypothetical protein WC247_06015 [Porticoccaceae bacterium]|jgi:hypothetical protein
MSNTSYTARAYLLLGCPFCFKFLLFMTEAGLLDQIEIVALDRNAGDYDSVKAGLEQRAGRSLSFPTVETEPGVFVSDTEALISHFRTANQLGDRPLPVLDFYQRGLFENVVRLHKENRALKEQLDG